MKFVRILFFYILYFCLAMVVLVIFFQPGSEGFWLLFLLIAPGLMVWWREKRRAHRQDTRTPVQLVANDQSPVLEDPSVTVTINPLPDVRNQPPPSLDANPVSPANTTKRWQQLDNSALIRKAREAGPELAEIAARKEAEKEARRTELESPALSISISRGKLTGSKVTPRGKSAQLSGWILKDQTVSVRGRNINGMIYVGTPPTMDGYGDKCRAYIDPSLSVARKGDDKTGAGMSYWPGYSTISPESRTTYLDWLADGARDASYNPGYMFLYFYGLERRFFADDPGVEEKCDLLGEVRRLMQVYADNRSAQGYLGRFIEFASALSSDVGSISPVFDNPGWEIPFSVKLAIGHRLQQGEILGADWVLSWFLCHPEKILRTPAKRCQEEFMALFRLRFKQRFPAGLKVNKPRKSLQINYPAASGEFEVTVSPSVDGKSVPDISGLRKPIEIAQEIADEAMAELDKLSRYLGRNPEGRGNVEAHALLPMELRQIFPSDELEKIKAWVSGIVNAGGLVDPGEVLERLEGERPEKPGKRQLIGAADALARIGFGLAPDPRFALRSPKADEPVVLFDLGNPVEQLEDVSARYKAALAEMALAAVVAHADGVISDLERTALDGHARSVAGLTGHEQRLLAANLTWFLAVPPDLPLLRRKLKESGAEQQSAIRAALIAAAHADGIVKPDEVAEIEKLYRALGLDPDLVYSDLHAGEVPDVPLRVREARPGAPGEAIPETPGQTLDAARIARIRQDTDRVSAVLADIFVTDTNAGESEPAATLCPLAGLDAKHTALIREVITRPHWSEEDFVSLATRHDLMAAGALETLNEWSFGVYDEALLDEYEGYDLSPDIAEELAGIFEKES